MAFGEVLFEEHSSSFKSPYLFNGKELDRETNLSYYSVRYLDMKTSLWLTVDPLAVYNPIKSYFNIRWWMMNFCLTSSNVVTLRIELSQIRCDKHYPMLNSQTTVNIKFRMLLPLGHCEGKAGRIQCSGSTHYIRRPYLRWIQIRPLGDYFLPLVSTPSSPFQSWNALFLLLFLVLWNYVYFLSFVRNRSDIWNLNSVIATLFSLKFDYILDVFFLFLFFITSLMCKYKC